MRLFIDRHYRFFLAVLLCLSFLASDISYAFEAKSVELSLNLPESELFSRSATDSLCLKGLSFDINDPMAFEFFFDGDKGKELHSQEAARLIRYFLTALTMPQEKIWVNLSPYESNRIIDDELAKTELGVELLAQDYVLKQTAASLTHPETALGQTYWQRFNGEKKSPDSDNFAKIWIVPGDIALYQDKNHAFITKSNLKALSETDYLALQKNKFTNDSGKKFANDFLLAIEDKLNKGESFAKLRQVYNSLILAFWFKKQFKDSFYSAYIDSQKLKGVDNADAQDVDVLYREYIKAFKKGVYDFVRKEYDPEIKRKIKRHYFSGGFTVAQTDIESSAIHADLDLLPNSSVVSYKTKFSFIDQTQSSALLFADLDTTQTKDMLKDKDKLKKLPQYYIKMLKASLVQDKIYLKHGIDRFVDIFALIDENEIYLYEDHNAQGIKIGSSDNKILIAASNLIERDEINKKLISLLIEKEISKSLELKRESDKERIAQNVVNYIYRSSDASYFTCAGGGTGGNLVAQVSEKLVNVGAHQGQLPISFIVTAFDKGGGSGRLIHDIKVKYGYWTPPAGDLVNIISGLSEPFWKYIIRRRVGDSDKDHDKMSFNELIDLSLSEALETNPGFDQAQISEFKENIAEYLDYFDENLIEDISVSQGQTIGNLLQAAMMIKNEAYNSQGVNEELYSMTMTQLAATFGIYNAKIMPVTFEEADMYAKLEHLEMRTEDNPIGLALKEGQNDDYILKKTEWGFELRFAKAPGYTLVIDENFADEIRDDTATDVRVYKDGEFVNKDYLLPDGDLVEIDLDGFKFSLRSRLAIGEDVISDKLNLSKFVETGFTYNSKPKASNIVKEIVRNTKGAFFIGPSSLETSILTVFASDGFVDELVNLRQTTNVPISLNVNPYTDNDTVNVSYDDIKKRFEDVSGVALKDMVSHALINDIDSSLERLGLSEGHFDELSTKRELIELQLKEEAAELGKYAKSTRGLIAGDASKFKAELEADGIKVIHKDILRKIEREKRSGGGYILGYIASDLTQLFENDVVYNSLRQTAKWMLLERQLSESVLLSRLHKVKEAWPNMTLVEALEYVYDLSTQNNDKFLLPFFDINKDLKTKPKVLVMNFSNLIGESIVGHETSLKVKDDVLNSMSAYLRANPDTYFVISTGQSYSELRNALFDNERLNIDYDLRKQIVLITESGSKVRIVDEENSTVAISTAGMVKREHSEAVHDIILDVLDETGLDRELKDISGTLIAEPLRMSVRGEYKYSIETKSWLFHPESRIPEYLEGGKYSDVKDLLVDKLKERIEKHLDSRGNKLPYDVTSVGSCIDVILKKVDSDIDMRSEATLRVLDFELPFWTSKTFNPNEIMFLGRMPDAIAENSNYSSSPRLRFNIDSLLIDSDSPIYPIIGDDGLCDFLLRLNELPQNKGGIDFKEFDLKGQSSALRVDNINLEINLSQIKGMSFSLNPKARYISSIREHLK